MVKTLKFHYRGHDCILSPCLFNLYTEYIMQNAGLDEVEAGIKIAVDTTLVAESVEPLADFLFLGSKISAYHECSHEIK